VTPETGLPSREGVYLTWIASRSRSAPGFTEPVLTTWHNGRWHRMEPVYGWIGPLPVLKTEDFSVPEYDL
jgi:hypothetical protein